MTEQALIFLEEKRFNELKAVLETLKTEGCFEGWPDTNQMSLFDMF